MCPMYEYICKCGATRADMRTIEERHDGPRCERHKCGKKMKLQMSATRGVVKNPAAGERRRK